jgi:ribosomal protein S24E
MTPLKTDIIKDFLRSTGMEKNLMGASKLKINFGEILSRLETRVYRHQIAAYSVTS